MVLGNAVLYVTDSISFNGKDSIYVDTGASLTIYMGGLLTYFNSAVNPNSTAKSLTYYGLPNNQLVILTGQANMSGNFYAPNAAVIMNGSSDLQGRIVAKSATLSGSSAFHFDEALGSITNANSGIFKILSWNEL